MAGRRTRGEGSIYQRESDGRWVGVVDLGWVGGKRVRRTATAATLRELRPKFKALREMVERGVLTDEMTVDEWMGHWLDKIAPHAVKPRTLSTYRGYSATWIVPTLGKRKVRDLRPDHVRAMHEAMRQAGRSETTARQAHMILRKALADAVHERRIPYNPAEVVKAPRAAKVTHGVLSEMETRALLDLLAEYGNDGLWWVTSRFLVALAQGLRQGEALGLRWEHVDLTPGRETLRLRQAIQRQKGNGLVVVPLKTKESVDEGRDVPLLAEVAYALRMHRGSAPDGYVWGGERPMDPRRDWGVWKGLLWSAGCADHPLHAARATTASVLDAAGVSLKTIAEILGHSQITTAWAHYVHSDDRQQREGLESGWRGLIQK